MIICYQYKKFRLDYRVYFTHHWFVAENIICVWKVKQPKLYRITDDANFEVDEKTISLPPGCKINRDENGNIIGVSI